MGRAVSTTRLSGLQGDIAAVGGLSNPSKMPGHSWSLPATECRIGSQLAKHAGTVCHGCYALKGAYSWSSTQTAMRRRLGILQGALADPGKRNEFVSAFVRILETRHARDLAARARGRRPAQDGRSFRWHDSGDLQSMAHLEILAEIASQVPQVKFWLPTREAPTVRAYLETHGAFPANLIVRVSANRVDGRAPAGFATVSGVHTRKGSAPDGMLECRAYRTRADGSDAPDRIGTPETGHCGDCRACWDSSTPAVSYPLH